MLVPVFGDFILVKGLSTAGILNYEWPTKEGRCCLGQKKATTPSMGVAFKILDNDSEGRFMFSSAH